MASLSLIFSGHPMDSLIDAAMKGNSRFVRDLIQQGHSPDTRDEHGETALTWAAYLGHTSVVKDLLAAGADQEAKGKYFQATPLILAAQGGHRGIVALLAALSNLNERDPRGATALMLALEPKTAMLKSQSRVITIMNTLLQAGADIDLQDQNGNTALIWAVTIGNVEAARLLLTSGANPHLKNENGQTALALAIQLDHPEMITLLAD